MAPHVSRNHCPVEPGQTGALGTGAALHAAAGAEEEAPAADEVLMDALELAVLPPVAVELAVAATTTEDELATVLETVFVAVPIRTATAIVTEPAPVSDGVELQYAPAMSVLSCVCPKISSSLTLALDVLGRIWRFRPGIRK